MQSLFWVDNCWSPAEPGQQGEARRPDSPEWEGSELHEAQTAEMSNGNHCKWLGQAVIVTVYMSAEHW